MAAPGEGRREKDEGDESFHERVVPRSEGTIRVIDEAVNKRRSGV
jgi:hypothetical protein